MRLLEDVSLIKDNGVTTRGNLQAARIVEVKVSSGNKVTGHGDFVNCMFNPYEYTVTKNNTFTEKKSANGGNSPIAELSQAGAQTLQLDLTFDTTHTGEDVTLETRKLWKFMRIKEDEKGNPLDKGEVPLVAFHWGVFYFVSYITSMTQKFTLFMKDGTPVRAKVNVTFTQYLDVEDYYPKQNPTSGDGPLHRTWQVTAGDRLDLIAADVYKDATRWREIADYNGLVEPTDLQPGRMLLIPIKQ